jgi:uncharacterized protein (DUF2147 family)
VTRFAADQRVINGPATAAAEARRVHQEADHRYTSRLAAASVLAAIALLTSASTARAADGTWERSWGNDVVQEDQPGDVDPDGFEICTVAASCKFGTGGSLGGELSTPLGVAVDDSGNVYVAEANNQRIQKFDSDGTWERAWGKDVVTGGGTGFEICTVAADCKAGVGGGLGGELSQPQDVAVDDGGNVYVADGGATRIQKFDSNGTWERAWGKDVVNGGGTGFEICTVATNCKVGDLNGELGGEFRGPHGVAVDDAGDVYVGDEIRQRIQKFDSDGNWERAWGKDVVTGGGTGFEVCTVAANCKSGVEGGLGGEFNNPRRLAVDGAGDVYVGDVENQRIQKFDSDGTWDRAWGKDVVTGGGTGFEICTVAADCKQGEMTGGLGGEFVNPIGVAADGAGDIYVADRDNMRIQKFEADGDFLRAWGNDVVQEDQPGDVDPEGFEICTDAADCKSGQLGSGLGGEVPQPDGIAADASGNVYATTPGAQRIQKFTDPQPPDAPTITDTDPDSPANDNDPEVKGTVGAGSPVTVNIYENNSTCTGTPDATDAVAQFTGAGITVNVPDDSSTDLRATTVDSVGNESGCSAVFTYVEQSGGPPPPPPPPANEPDPPAAEEPLPELGQSPGPCANEIRGTPSDDTLFGTDAGDAIRGEGGHDTIDGRAGDDCLRGGRGRDTIEGDEGNDVIHVRRGRRDKVDCGAGDDTVIAGSNDAVAGDCETVKG